MRRRHAASRIRPAYAAPALFAASLSALEHISVLPFTERSFYVSKVGGWRAAERDHTAVGCHHLLGKGAAVQQRFSAGHLHRPKVVFKVG